MITTIILASTVTVYILQLLFLHVMKVDYVSTLLAFQVGSFRGGAWWQLLTYGWVHSAQMPIHILFNMLTVHFIGRELEWRMGGSRYLQLYIGGLVGAVLFWFLCEKEPMRSMETLAGASGAVFALFAAMAAFNPHRHVKVLLMFVIPLRGEIRWFFIGAVVFEVICWKLNWMPFIAHTAHIGGALVGWILGRWWRPRWEE